MIGDYGYTIEIYRLNVVSGAFELIDIITTAQNLQFFNKLSGIGGCSFNMSIYDNKLNRANFIRYRNQIAVRKGRSVLFFGPITKLSGTFTDVKGSVTIEANSYLEHLRYRYTDKFKVYSTEEQGEIAWDLIDTVQSRTNGGLIITQGTTITSVDRDRTYEYSEVAQALINLSNVIDGFDFEFATSLDGGYNVNGVVFNCYYPYLGNVRDDLNSLRIGENVQRLGFVTNSELINTITAEGAGSGSPIIYSQSNSALQQGYTRREAILGYKDVSVQSTLENKVDFDLNSNSTERFLIEVNMMPSKAPVLGQYGLGDILNFDLNIDGGDYVQFSGQGRVMEIGVTVDENGSEMVIPKLEVLS